LLIFFEVIIKKISAGIFSGWQLKYFCYSVRNLRAGIVYINRVFNGEGME